MKRWAVLFGLAALGIGAHVGAHAQAQLPRFGFESSTEGWISLPPPAGVRVSLGLTDDPADAKVGKRALRAVYRTENRKLAAIMHPVDGLAGAGVRVWLRTDTPATLVLGLAERGGATYQHVVQTLPGKWLLVEAPYSSFSLSDDSKDADGRLDPDQVNMLIIADAGGFMPGAGGERTLCVDGYEVADDVLGPAPKPYVPLLDTGSPTASGARATAGVRYVPGRFGQGALVDAPGGMVVVPIGRPGTPPRRRWDQGTAEMWLSPRFDMAHVRDYTGLLAMQSEPFMPGFRGSLLVFYTQGAHVAFMLNGGPDLVAATPPLTWKAGSWHHLAVSWGPGGMRIYVDGKRAGANPFTGGPGIMAADVVVGNHAWPIASHRFADTVIDDLRLSARQREDSEVAATFGSAAPVRADNATLALEHFDGRPQPPITLSERDLPWQVVRVGRPLPVAVRIPGPTRSDARFSYLVSTPSGLAVARGALPRSRSATVAKIGLPGLSAPGFYRIAVRQEERGAIVNRGSGWIRAVGGPGVAARSLLFGASACYADTEDNEAYFRRASAAGVRSVRMPFEWFEIEPERGRFVWDKYDRIAGWAARYGVELIPTFIWEKAQPAWAGGGEAKPGFSSERYPPQDLEIWSEFVFRVVARYKGTVHWWIPANEPNLARYWHPKPDARQYVALLKATWSAARRADPGARILGCSASGLDLRFLEDCFAAGALQYCDAVGVHPYICPHSPDERIPLNMFDPASPPGTFRDGLVAAGALIARYGGKQKLWLDEAGQPYRDDFVAPNWGVPEATAAEYLAKEYVEALSSGVVERVLWFSFWGGDYGSFALLKPDGSPTLPLAAFAAAADRLTGLAPIVGVARPGGVCSRAFGGGQRALEVVWSLAGARTLGLQPGQTAHDLYGFPLTEASRSRRVSLTSRPVYLVRSASAR